MTYKYILVHAFAYFVKKVFTGIYSYILFYQNEKKYVPVHTGTYQYILFDPFSYHGTGFQMNYINHNVSHHVMSDLQSWLSGQSVALNKREIASSDSSGVLLPY